MSLDDLGRLNEIHCECKELKFEVVYKYTLLSEILLFFIDSSAFKHTFSMSNLMDYLGISGPFVFLAILFCHPSEGRDSPKIARIPEECGDKGNLV